MDEIFEYWLKHQMILLMSYVCNKTTITEFLSNVQVYSGSLLGVKCRNSPNDFRVIYAEISSKTGKTEIRLNKTESVTECMFSCLVCMSVHTNAVIPFFTTFFIGTREHAFVQVGRSNREFTACADHLKAN